MNEGCYEAPGCVDMNLLVALLIGGTQSRQIRHRAFARGLVSKYYLLMDQVAQLTARPQCENQIWNLAILWKYVFSLRGCSLLKARWTWSENYGRTKFRWYDRHKLDRLNVGAFASRRMAWEYRCFSFESPTFPQCQVLTPCLSPMFPSTIQAAPYWDSDCWGTYNHIVKSCYESPGQTWMCRVWWS